VTLTLTGYAALGELTLEKPSAPAHRERSCPIAAGIAIAAMPTRYFTPCHAWPLVAATRKITVPN
jgi:hypothetical protein